MSEEVVDWIMWKNDNGDVLPFAVRELEAMVQAVLKRESDKRNGGVRL